MVTYSCDSCNMTLDYYHDVYELTETETETKEGLIRSKEVEKELHVGWACTYCDNELPELVGNNLNSQYRALRNLSSIRNILSSALSSNERFKIESDE